MNTNVHRVDPGSKVRMKDFDPDASPLCDDKADGKQKCVALQERLGELQELLYAEHRHKVLIILQGMDTSGKDGTVRHVMNGVSPAGVRVVSFKKPTEEKVWRKRYEQINAFEKTLAASGTVIVKFFLNISRDEQRKRLQERIDDPK